MFDLTLEPLLRGLPVRCSLHRKQNPPLMGDGATTLLEFVSVVQPGKANEKKGLTQLSDLDPTIFRPVHTHREGTFEYKSTASSTLCIAVFTITLLL